MEPKRLIGLELYEEYANFTYGNNDIGFRDDAVGRISKAFLSGNGQLKDSKKISRAQSNLDFDVMQLGWGTVAKFMVTDEGFVLSYIKICNESKHKSTVTANDLFGQVVTRAVDTCTFVYLQSGDTVVLAHLDSDEHTEGLQAIMALMPKTNKVVGFCSFIENDPGIPVKREFCNELKKLYGDGIKFCDRATIGYLYYGHFEIGMYLNDDKAVDLFGDITFVPCAIRKTTPCFLFKSISEISIDENGSLDYPVETDFNQQNNSDDGHKCIIS